MRLSATFIATLPAGPYFRPMLSRCLRILTLVALVLMPFTMGSAPAQAQSAHSAMAKMSSEHCADHQDNGAKPVTDMAQCMLMCAALPAAEALSLTPPVLPRTPLILSAVKSIHGIILEIATPPPRSA